MATARGKNGIAASVLPALLGAVGGFLLSTMYINSTSGWSGRSLEEAEATDDEHHHEDKEEEGFELAVSESIIIIVLVLIILTIAFEEAKEAIEESVDRNMKPIIESLFGEITVLGFLSLFTFCVTKLGVFEQLSVKIFGEEEAEELFELFESVHYALFFVMVLFVFLVLFLVGDGIKTEREWMEMDRECRDPQYIAKCVDRMAQAEQMPVPFLRRVKACFVSVFPSIRSSRNASVADILHFYALRREFILERSIQPPFQPAPEKNRVPEDFNFGRYLSVSLGHTLAHSVHLGITTWLCIALFAILFFFVMMIADMDIVILAWVWAGVGLLVFVMGTFLDLHLDNINKSFARFNTSLGDTDPENQPLVSATNGSGGKLPPWCSIDLDAYLQSRSFLQRKLAKATPNRQDSLFWFERRGPHLCTRSFQLNLIFTAIYGALLVLTFLPAIYKHSSTAVLVSYLIVTIVPLLVTKIQRRHIAAEMTQAISMGIHRKPQIVSHVTIEEKTARVVRAFVVINKLLYAAEHDLFAANSSTSAASDPALSLGPVERADIEKTFDGFDPDGSGCISPQELRQIFIDLGAPLTDDMMTKILQTLDENGDGKIVKDEFVNFYARHVMSDNRDERSIDDRAHDMFKLFDRSGDKDITIGEFKATLDAFNYNFTVDEVGALIEELDEDDKGTVGWHEFQHLLHKFDYMFHSHQARELPLI